MTDPVPFFTSDLVKYCLNEEGAEALDRLKMLNGFKLCVSISEYRTNMVPCNLADALQSTD